MLFEKETPQLMSERDVKIDRKTTGHRWYL